MSDEEYFKIVAATLVDADGRALDSALGSPNRDPYNRVACVGYLRSLWFINRDGTITDNPRN